jgi:hypothetical protein
MDFFTTMKQQLSFFAILVSLALVGWTACTKTTPFGEDLLADQLADYDFTDTIQLKCTVVPEDSALVTSDRNTAPFLLCGLLDDPIFGKAESEIFTLVQLSTFSPDFDPVKTKLDSIVMYIRYDPDNSYGDTSQVQTLKVQRLSEQLDWDKDYRSNNTLSASPDILGTASFSPNRLVNDSLVSTTKKARFIRVRLNDDFGREMMALDSITLTNDTLFWEKLRGFKITTAANSTPGAVLALDLNDEDLFSRVRLYYTKDDTLKKTFDYYFSGTRKFAHFKHDYTGTPIASALNQVATDRMYMQGMGGLRLKVEFPYASSLENIAVNKAELVLNALADPIFNEKLAPAEQLFALYKNTDSTEQFIPDVLYALGTGAQTNFKLFGGTPVAHNENGQVVYRYRLNLTQYFQDIVDDKTGLDRNRSIYLTVYPNIRSAMRSVLQGPTNVSFPAKLEMKYTRIK